MNRLTFLLQSFPVTLLLSASLSAAEQFRKEPDGSITGTATAIQTSYADTTRVDHAAEAVIVRASDNTSGHAQAQAVVSRGTRSETTHALSQPQVVIEQREHGGRELPAMEDSFVPVQAPDAGRVRLALAWKRYGAGKISEAATLFGSLLSHPGISRNAAYGLARCHLARKDFAKALPLLELLVKKRYRMRDTLPELMMILLDRQEFQKAADYAALSGEKELTVWERKIEQGIFLRKYEQIRERGRVPEAVAFVNEHDGVLKRCEMPETFGALAAFFARSAMPDEATSIYRTLISCTGDEGLQLGILYDLKPLAPSGELLKQVEQILGTKVVSPAHRAKLETFTLEVLYGLLASEPGNVEKNARAVFKIRPADHVALTTLGWWYLNNQRYEEAYGCFRQLNSDASKRTEYVEGMIHALTRQERLDEAFTVARLNGSDQKIAAMTEEINLKILWNRVASLPPDSPDIEALANDILRIRPDDEDIRVVRAWWNYKREEYEKAYEEFNHLYSRNPRTKGYAYGLASSLDKLRRHDDAAGIASENKQHDERLAALETGIYLERARIAYERNDYKEAELYFGKVVAADPEDEEPKALLESSRYRQTTIAKALSPIVGLSGHTWGTLYHDLQGTAGTGASLLVHQGIDWVRLPWDILLRTYGEVWYRSRSKLAQYYDIAGQGMGAELTTSAFRLGAEYASERYTRQNKSNTGAILFLGWYHEWYKYMHDNSDDADWLNIFSLSGSTYGKVSRDLVGSTGTTVSGSINQGIDWLTLPGNIMLNSFAEYRLSLRTRDNLYYNEHGPVVGTELQKPPFKAGLEYYWEHDIERHLSDQRATVYLKWYYGWDLKPNK